MRRVFGAVVLILFAGVLAQHADARCDDVIPQARPQNTARDIVGHDLDQIVERGFIEFATYENFPPYSYLKDGEPVGIDIDIGMLIAEELGVDARFRLVPASDTVEADLRNYVWRGAVVNGRVSNVMLHVPYDSNFACRIEHVVFTGQYYKESIAIAYSKEAYPDNPPVPAYFRFDKVAVENDSISDFYLTSLAGGQLRANIRRFPTAKAAMEALANGEVKAAMAPRAQLEHGITADIAVHQPPLPGFGVGSWTVGVAVHQAYRPLAYSVDDAIYSALSDGRMQAIFEKHGLTFAPPDR